MKIYPEDDPKLLNPNVLKGHEGSLLMALQPIAGTILGNQGITDARYTDPNEHVLHNSERVQIPNKGIVMLLKVHEKYHDVEAEFAWFGKIEILFGEKRVLVYINPNQWLRYFIPWPHEVFIQRQT